jgi:uncharacterized protein (TIGR03083 family)
VARAFSSDEVLRATQGTRARSIALLRSVNDAEASTPVLTCPGWTVREVACHLSGVCDDLLHGRLTDIGSDAWTDAQVRRQDAQSLGAILDEWEGSAARFDELVPLIPEPSNLQLVMDQVNHEQDLRLALSIPGAQDEPAVSIGLEFLLLLLRRTDAGFADEVRAAVPSDFELLRALSGRRSAAQLEALGIDPGRLTEHLAPTPMSIAGRSIPEHSA